MTAAVPEPPHLVTDLRTLCLATMATEWRPLAARAARERQWEPFARTNQFDRAQAQARG